MWTVVYILNAQTHKMTVEAPSLYKVAKVVYAAIGHKVAIVSIQSA